MKLRDVHAMRYVLWPVHGIETIDGVGFAVSPDFVRSLPSVPINGVRVSVAFHSGAALEVICDELTLDVTA